MIGHPLAAQQRHARIEVDPDEQVGGPVQEGAQRRQVEHHLRLEELGAGRRHRRG